MHKLLTYYISSCISVLPQANSVCPLDAKPGGLVLELQAVWEECGLQLALCRPPEPQPPQEDRPSGQLLVLFDRDTATHLLAGPGDTVHVQAPW